MIIKGKDEFARELGFNNWEELMGDTQEIYREGDISWNITSLNNGRYAAWNDAELATDRVKYFDTEEEAIRYIQEAWCEKNNIEGPMTFEEFIDLCDVSDWEIINGEPEAVYEQGEYAIVRVVPADDPDFKIRYDIPAPKGICVVDWGQPAALTDDPYQEAYAIYRKIDEGHWKCMWYLYATLEEAKEALEELLQE